MSAGDPARIPYRVLATSDVFEPGFRGGGPVRSVAHLLDTVSAQVEVKLMTGDRDLGSPRPYPGLSGRWVERGRAHVFYLDVRHIGQWLRLYRRLQRSTFDLLYVNSLWSPLFTVIPIVAVWLGLIRAKDVLIAPRGELCTGALSIKARKKRLFLGLWRPLLKRINVLWHATAEEEAADIRAVFPWAVIKIASVQVALPAEPLPPILHNKAARLIHISRISAKKNLLLVYRALCTVSQPVVLDIYGPVEDQKYWAQCQALAELLPGHVQARYLGALPPAQVRATFGLYDAFVFPTLGENFGHIIAESLSASCPVICSTETPWTSILKGGGGAVLEALTPECLGVEIDRVGAFAPVERFEMRLSSGRAYRLWREGADGTNILDIARQAS